jgi:tRNA A37 methylthiotransferase MiaB
MPKKLYLETVGCQMNVLDSELVVGGLRRAGYSLTDSPKDADLILFNTAPFANTPKTRSTPPSADSKITNATARKPSSASWAAWLKKTGN